jgi:hypothetical protein
VIEPRTHAAYDIERTLLLGEWNLNSDTGATRPPMQMEGSFPNYFTINGKAYPATDPIKVKRGQRVLLRVIGGMQFAHPMHPPDQQRCRPGRAADGHRRRRWDDHRLDARVDDGPHDVRRPDDDGANARDVER